MVGELGAAAASDRVRGPGVRMPRRASTAGGGPRVSSQWPRLRSRKCQCARRGGRPPGPRWRPGAGAGTQAGTGKQAGLPVPPLGHAGGARGLGQARGRTTPSRRCEQAGDSDFALARCAFCQ